MLILKIYYHITAIIKKIFYKIIYGKHIKFGKGVTFRKGFSLVIENGAVVEIGDGCFFNNHCSINAREKIEIGENCLFGENVKLYDHNHVFKIRKKLIKEQGFKNGEIKIGNDCWICSNTTILKDVRIGEHCVIGVGCIVNQDIASNKMVKMKNDYILEDIKS